MKKKSPETGLTELESLILSAVWKHQPTTAYQVRHAFSQSPSPDVPLSQGSIYPAVERLKKRGYIKGVASGDARQTEHLTCTEEGEGAIKAWLFDMPRRLPADPLRPRILALPILSESERVQWIRTAQAAVLETIAAVEEFSQVYSTPLYEIMHDNARSLLLAKVRWLERVEARLESAVEADRN